MYNKTQVAALVAVLSIGLLTACSQTSFVDAQGQQTGFRWYDPKPHLLVKRSLGTKAILEATVEILPDMDRPQFVKHRGGLGSGGFTVETQNGVLTKFSQNSKDAGPSTLNKMSAAFKAFAEHELASRKARDELRAAKVDDGAEDVDLASSMELFEEVKGSFADGAEGPNVFFAPREGFAEFDRAQSKEFRKLLTDAREALRIYQACVRKARAKAKAPKTAAPDDCDAERKLALAAVKRVGQWLTVQLLAMPVTLDSQKKLQGLQAHVSKLKAALGKPKPKIEKYGAVAIYYELYEMEVCNGQVVGLQRVPAETACQLIQCAGAPRAVQACVHPDLIGMVPK